MATEHLIVKDFIYPMLSVNESLLISLLSNQHVFRPSGSTRFLKNVRILVNYSVHVQVCVRLAVVRLALFSVRWTRAAPSLALGSASVSVQAVRKEILAFRSSRQAPQSAPQTERAVNNSNTCLPKKKTSFSRETTVLEWCCTVHPMHSADEHQTKEQSWMLMYFGPYLCFCSRCT